MPKHDKHDKTTCYICKKPCVSPAIGHRLVIDGLEWMCHKECIDKQPRKRLNGSS